MYEADQFGHGLQAIVTQRTPLGGAAQHVISRKKDAIYRRSGPGLWLWHMRRGDFDAAWTMSDVVLEARRGTACQHLPRHEQWVWDGTPLAGRRVLVRCYHGLGDTLQFIRYAPLVKAVAREVIVWAQPKLIPLLRTARGIDRLMPLHDGAPDAQYDVDVELMELPHVFRTTLRDLPREVPYIHAQPLAAFPSPIERQSGRLHVGIAWRSGDWDARRSIPFALMARIAEIPGIVLHILQFGSGLEELPDGFGVLHDVSDISKMAAVVRALDLVVTVDSMPAHLAGALGTPVWTLLHMEPDWRWMAGREDSPWYPTMRLFRQERQGEWGPVVERVSVELFRLLNRGAPRCALARSGD
ncbi:glycosyltransferase family 9 protein [Desulfocurvibacter africanus]|uniref:glycosyltransferase family 9 protein n=1 Tax=Desulfocurvibacter africanus TaxID=873 RepID=UPI00042780CA|nr:glycosyltransferase family 9 protein [Desulfocurvibacter africanus]